MRLCTVIALVSAFGLVAGQTTPQSPTPSTATALQADVLCGINKYQQLSKSFLPQPFIAGGKDAEPHAYPWQVSLTMYGNHHCGGSLIGKRFVLTAAQCVSATSASNYKIIVGKQVLYLIEPNQRTYSVEAIRIHSLYNASTHENDIAIVKVDQDIDYNDDVKPVCLPPSFVGDLEGDLGSFTGWGAIYEGASTYWTLQVVNMQIISNAVCRIQYANLGTIFETNVCAEFSRGGKGSCQGDTGGPVVVYDSHGFALQVGIMSWSHGCGQANYASISTRVSKYIDWIRENDAATAHVSKVTVLSASILTIACIFTAN